MHRPLKVQAPLPPFRGCFSPVPNPLFYISLPPRRANRLNLLLEQHADDI